MVVVVVVGMLVVVGEHMLGVGWCARDGEEITGLNISSLSERVYACAREREYACAWKAA